MKNILVTSSGRRVELLQDFKREQRKYLPKNKLFAIDYRPDLSAACHIADVSHQCPKVTDPNYSEFLLEYCLNNKIGLVIPTIDTELILLSQQQQRFQKNGVYLCVSDNALIEKCRDKRKTGELLNHYEIKYPKIYSKDDLQFPCFAKPYNGSCSIGAKAIQNEQFLDIETRSNPDMIFMELIDKSYCEYTIDTYFDKFSNLKCLVPRKRIEVRAGEVSKGITKKNFLYESLIKKISHLSGARGCLTMQFFVNEYKRDYIGLEINPRFGGGYPLSYAAGANYPAWLIKEYLLDEPIDFFDSWENNLLMLRYDAKIIVHDANF